MSGVLLHGRTPAELLNAFQRAMEDQQADPVREPGIHIEVNADAESGFTSDLFKTALERNGVNLRIRKAGAGRKSSSGTVS